MLQLELRRLRLHVLAGAFFVGAMAALVPGAPALAQGPGAVRGLPDFTDLVEQVGPSVVNIRTLEKSRGNGNAGSPGDEDMQEFFRRFFGVPMPNMPRQGPRPNRPQEDEQPRASRTADIVASVPELTMRTISRPGTRAMMRSAIVTSSGLGTPNESPCAAVRTTASSTSGCAWPRIIGPQEPM